MRTVLTTSSQEAVGEAVGETSDSMAPAEGDVAADGTESSKKPETPQAEPEESPSDQEDTEPVDQLSEVKWSVSNV